MRTLPQRISEKQSVMLPRVGLPSCLSSEKISGGGYSVFKDGIVKRTTLGLFFNSYPQVKFSLVLYTLLK